MNISTEERIKALEVALTNESRERDFYLRHSERTANPLGKEMFQSIARDEEEHYQKILELSKKLKKEGRWPETLPLEVKGTEIRNVLRRVVESVDTSARADTDDMEAVKIAIDFEAKGEKFYGELRDGVNDPVEKEFYDLLAMMEREHRLSLEDTYEYFKDPEAWYRLKERPHADGA
ncbi:MAG: ferritin family protein [Deltaproteobacteria bacterium]|nr:ferritin family protein [Deltaproteobacteria bacterium]MBW2072830.1 ferritin family protein [Deltaproteobacteria bacterium]